MPAIAKEYTYITVHTPGAPDFYLLGPTIRTRSPREGMTSHERQGMLHTLPHSDEPVIDQLNDHLNNPRATYGDAESKAYAHPKYGDLGTSQDARAVAIKQLVASRFGKTSSLESMATMALAALFSVAPSYVSRAHEFAETYDIHADVHWARDEYGRGGIFPSVILQARELVAMLPPPRRQRGTEPVFATSPNMSL